MISKIKLLCFGYAGGTSMFYKSWQEYVSNNIEIIPIEIAGRGRRMAERPCESISNIVDDVYKEIKPYLDDTYAFFGHSMGTAIITELIEKIHKHRHKEPVHVFMSGRFPPHKAKEKLISNLPDDEFKNEIYNLGGTPEEVIENEELFKIFIPILRADYKCIEDYTYDYKIGNWEFDMSILWGTEDKSTNKVGYDEWRDYTKGNCNYYEFPGNHFFIHSSLSDVVKVINEKLL